MWDTYSCDKCDNYPMLAVLANFSDSKSAFQKWCDDKGGAHCAAVCKDEGGGDFNRVLKNDNWGHKQYLIKPDKTFKSYSVTDLSDNNIKPHNCNGSDQIAPVVSVQSPSQGEILKSGRVHEIKWKAQDNVKVTAVSLYFRKDSGDSWSKIDSLTTNNGVYQWTVPAVVSKSCQVVVRAYDAAKNLGKQESSLFEITPPSGISFGKNIFNGLVKVHAQQGSYSLQINSQEKSIISIFDVRGKEVYRFSTVNGEHTYTLGKNMVAGMYVISIKNRETSYHQNIYITK